MDGSKRRRVGIVLATLVAVAVVGLTVVACGDGPKSPTAPRQDNSTAAPGAAPGGGSSVAGEAPAGELAGPDGEPPAPGDVAPEPTAPGEPIFETADAKGGQPKNDLCHWDKDAMAYVLINVAQPGFNNHLAKHPMDKPLPTWWQDADGDGFGNAGVSTQACDQPAGFVDNDDDCRDDASSCTTDCSLDGDGDGRADCLDRCADADGDGWGEDTSGVVVGGGAIAVGSCTTDGSTPCDIGPACLGPDCDDSNAAINPAAADAVCDGVDDNCDGEADDEFVSQPTSCGVGECAANGNSTCVAGVEDDGCTEGTPETEICDTLDNDCDGTADEGGVCTGKVVFVSSQVYDGNFGMGQPFEGYTDADAVCQTLAGSAGLSGTFKAWLSGRPDGFGCGDGSGSDCMGQNAADRFTMNPGPYVLVGGTQVADDWGDLTDGSLDNPIERDEYGSLFTGTNEVWTNTTTSGLAADVSRNCGQGPNTDTGVWGAWSCGAPTWTAGDCQFQSGRYGFADSATSSWTNGGGSANDSCANLKHIYCFEQ